MLAVAGRVEALDEVALDGKTVGFTPRHGHDGHAVGTATAPAERFVVVLEAFGEVAGLPDVERRVAFAYDVNTTDGTELRAEGVYFERVGGA